MMNSTPTLLYPDWPAPPTVKAVTTTRRGGVSRGPFASFNLADHVGDDGAAVAHNRRRLSELLALPAEPLWLQQVHGGTIVDAGKCGVGAAADGSYTDRTGVVCAVLTADCLPVLLCDGAGRKVAVLHAGWRGMAAGIIEAGVAALAIPADNLMAWLGPAIGPRAFAVGREVREAFVARDPTAAAAFVDTGRRDRWFADLHALARARLHRLGLRAVYGETRCTHALRDDFYSYRRDGACGRMASLIWLVEGEGLRTED